MFYLSKDLSFHFAPTNVFIAFDIKPLFSYSFWIFVSMLALPVLLLSFSSISLCIVLFIAESLRFYLQNDSAPHTNTQETRISFFIAESHNSTQKSLQIVETSKNLNPHKTQIF